MDFRIISLPPPLRRLPLGRGMMEAFVPVKLKNT